MECPYDDCSFEGTFEELDDHVAYMIRMDDSDHAVDKRRTYSAYTITWMAKGEG